MRSFLPLISFLICCCSGQMAQDHPNLILTKSGIEQLQKNYESSTLFGESVHAAIAEVDHEIELGIQVPLPKDMAGGYTHERHKRNFFILQKAGNLYQITGNEKYAEYVRQSLMAYASMYPDLPLHPTNRSYATGKIFWQCLNDANWLVYCSQAYDCIYDWLSSADRGYLESELFLPMADFLSFENPKFFNRIHNHSTWANAAVGMIGLVMNNEELIERALYGLQDDGLDESMVDNDGGYIKIAGQRQAGFMAQLDLSFSPDGHFTEGPYYLRYAMTPFLMFAKGLSNAMPELDIYSYRDSILQKAIYALLNETDAKGQFFPINDAQKGMSWNAREVVAAVNIAYADFGSDPMLLSVAERQGTVLLDETGYIVSRDLSKGMSVPFLQQSKVYADGAKGDKGALTVLRTPVEDNGEICLVMKYAAHGLGHGHFDKLSFSLYDEVGEIVQDYGAARWVNIDQKGGGGYLPENNSFSKQSIGHNTLVINEQSHYKGSVKLAEEKSPQRFFEILDEKDFQAVSAKEYYAYPGVEMQRTMLLLHGNQINKPLVIDVFRVNSEVENQYDLPLWFSGHLLTTSFEINANLTSQTPLGDKNGYQHIWHEATGTPNRNFFQMTWFGNDRFHTISSTALPDDELIFARAGANDPNFNLRHDPVFIQRRAGAAKSVFASVIESHGTYSPVTEIPIIPFTTVDSLALLHDSDEYTSLKIYLNTGQSCLAIIANAEADKETSHELQLDNQMYKWRGPCFLEILENKIQSK